MCFIRLDPFWIYLLIFNVNFHVSDHLIYHISKVSWGILLLPAYASMDNIYFWLISLGFQICKYFRSPLHWGYSYFRFQVLGTAWILILALTLIGCVTLCKLLNFFALLNGDNNRTNTMELWRQKMLIYVKCLPQCLASNSTQ